jgi:hypothetical protein
MMNERKIRDAVRSYLMAEGFKIGDLTGVNPGDQIPLSWDLDDIHFVRKSESGEAYTSDDKFKEFQDRSPGDAFAIRSAFAFQQNAPARDNDAYPSHLEDVLEALKGKRDTVYMIPEKDMRQYVSDGTRIIARSIVDDIDDRVQRGDLPEEVKEARISIYVTPSSSNHVNDYVEDLRSSLTRYIGSRVAVKKKTAKSDFSKNAYKECAEEIKKSIDIFTKGSDRLGTYAYFFEKFSKKKYEEAVGLAKEKFGNIYERLQANPDAFPEVTQKFVRNVVMKIRRFENSIKDFQLPGNYLSSTDVDVNRSFRKIPVSQDPGIQADQAISRQFTKQIGDLTKETNPGTVGIASEIDLSKVQKQQLTNLSPFIKKRWGAWQKQAVPSRLTVSDLIKDFEDERRGDIPDWRKRMLAKKKSDFSISVVPSRNRTHVSDFIKADTSTLPTFTHIAIIADDNMESGVTLREMRRVFDRIRNQSNPPLAIYGAPLLMIRGQHPTSRTHEKSYTGRRKSKLPVAAPLSNIPESSELYKRIIDRLAVMGNPEFELAEPEEESDENQDKDPR